MTTQLPAPIRVLLHWYKHTLAETTARPVRTLDGKLEEYGDPDSCDICVAVLIGMEYHGGDGEELLAAAETTMRTLQAEATRRGIQL